MKRFLVMFFILLAITVSSSLVYAERITQTDVTIDILGSHWDTPLYMTLIEGFDTTCKFNLIYCKKVNKDCPFYYSTALAAKLTNRKLKEIRYEHDPDTDYCDLVLISIQ
ncbi:hypothetical protein H206_01224 [Candidatus Electrothrix aarhusensis]|uniref:Uncharacterized protein n=1 Tax=Candidatus Electrothrix aarhusensis TaxID=1859131 RepID=A0A444IVL5_9BACT|nr:hypothetical protein H206_01224 [Candidatus Electrothrix aarhusensis]